MGRFLFVVPPFPGHVHPLLATAEVLERRGHETAWVGLAGLGDDAFPASLLPVEIRMLCPGAGAETARVARSAARAEAASDVAGGWRFLWEDVLIPLARETLPAVEEAIEAYRPDALVVDSEALAGAIAARRGGYPWATSRSTPVDWVGELADLPGVRDWTMAALAELQRDAGLDPVPHLQDSPDLVLVFSTPTFIGPLDDYPERSRFVGPAIGGSRADIEFPWEALDPGPKVLVSLGSLNPERGERFFDRLARALEGVEAQVIVAAPERFGPFPGNFLARPWIPQLELMPSMDAVVCHAGYNTVAEALVQGVPLVVLPIRDDQPVIAGWVEERGAGLRLSFRRFQPRELREAVGRVLAEPGFRRAAARIGASFRAAGGAERAAELLEGLLPG